MGKRVHTIEKIRTAIQDKQESGDSLAKVARRHQIPRSTLREYWEEEAAPPVVRDKVQFPPTVDDDIPTREIIDMMKKRYNKKVAFAERKKWLPINMPDDGPCALGIVGDPHVDDDGCNWPLLDKHCDIMRETEGFYAMNIGDTTNNWTGRLMRLFADQNTSQDTARKLAKWLLTESGVSWLVWLIGNHDAWNDGAAILKLMNENLGTEAIEMHDWEAQFKMVFPNKNEVRIDARHDFKGHSMWAGDHGMRRAAHGMAADWAHIYCAGHKHNWSIHKEESAHRDFTYWLVRARGYKFVDSHASHHGHASQKYGATVTAVIDPSKKDSTFIQCYEDVEEAADILNFKRGKWHGR